jgi:hypothetical protein
LRGENIRDKETRGRERKLDNVVINKIIHEIGSQPVGEKTRSWEELCKLAGVEGVAPITLKRTVESAGYSKCSHCQRGIDPQLHEYSSPYIPLVTKAHGMGKDAKDCKEPANVKERAKARLMNLL